VRRNRAKRVLREAWRALLPRIRNGYHIVFVARKSIDGAKTRELTIEIEGLLTAAGVIER
jgi:ribonuclease P protein component